MRFFFLIILKVLFLLDLEGQSSLSLNNDSLVNSLEAILKKINPAIKERNFIIDGSYDYYNSINSSEIAYELNSALSKIKPPIKEDQIAEITFVKCHNWEEAYGTWYITVVGENGDHYIYFYVDNKGINQIELYTVKQGKNYFDDLASNLMFNSRCSEKNEDYLAIGKLAKGRFVSYHSTQIFHQMDMLFFNDMLQALHP